MVPFDKLVIYGNFYRQPLIKEALVATIVFPKSGNQGFDGVAILGQCNMLVANAYDGAGTGKIAEGYLAIFHRDHRLVRGRVKARHDHFPR